jgi:cell division inhibitor SulA
VKAGRRFTKLMAPQNRQKHQYLQQSGLQTYIKQLKQKRSLHINKRRKKDIKAHIDSNTVVPGDCNTPLSPIDRLSNKKSTKKS